MSEVNITAIMNELCPTWGEAISELSISQQANIKKAVTDYYLYKNIVSLSLVENVAFVLSKTYIDGDLSIKIKGEGKLHWNWKGGITPENHKIRQSTKYKRWIKLVFKRDKYICQCCGRKGGKLNAHNIKSFAKHPELRLVIENGITYCNICHRKWHKENGRGG